MFDSLASNIIIEHHYNHLKNGHRTKRTLMHICMCTDHRAPCIETHIVVGINIELWIYIRTTIKIKIKKNSIYYSYLSFLISLFSFRSQSSSILEDTEFTLQWIYTQRIIEKSESDFARQMSLKRIIKARSSLKMMN